MTIRCRTKYLVSGHAPQRGQATGSSVLLMPTSFQTGV